LLRVVHGGGMLRLITKTAVVLFLVCFSGSTVYAHNVWCHCSFKDPRITLEFFIKAGDVYHVLSNDVIKKWHDTNTPLEYGVLAEFLSKQKSGTPLQPHLFLDGFDLRLKELREITTKGIVVPEFETSLSRIFAEDYPFERVRDSGIRYSNVGGESSSKSTISSGMKVQGFVEVVDVLRADLEPLKKTLDEVIVGLRNVLPLAEKGEFAAVMLSGRNAFGDKMPQFTNMLSAYERLYVRSCMNTITATMQIYPRGFEWLAKKP
jgi:hypothetical protein